MINPIFLRSFCTLVETKHFTRTAEKLFMTQSGVSQHIHKLEEQIGHPLLIRQGKGFELTDMGERLYQESKAIILSLSNLEQNIKTDSPVQGEVRVMSPGSVGLKLYPHLLALQKQHPELIINYRFAPNHDIEARTCQNHIDIGLMTQLSTQKEIDCQSIADEPLLLVTPAGLTQPDWNALMQLGFIDHPDGSYHASLLLAANYPEFQHFDQLKRSGFCNQIHLILQPVTMGLGFTVLPSHAVQDFSRPDLIEIHSLLNPVKETLYLVNYRPKPLPNRVKTVIRIIKKALNAHPV